MRIRLSLIIILLLFIGCSGSIKKDSAIGLVAAKDTFVSTATTAKRLCEQGVIPNDDCAEIEASYVKGRELLIAAKDVWSAMVESGSMDDMGRYQAIINEVVKITGKVEMMIREDI